MRPVLPLTVLLFHSILQESSSFAGRPIRKNNSNGKKFNQSTENKRKGYMKRASGIKTKRKKPPKWEQEGDSLFFLHLSETSDEDAIKTEFSSPQELLQSKFKKTDSNQRSQQNRQEEVEDERSATDFKRNKSPFMWGDISAGPIMSPKLNDLFPDPTPIQSQAFSVLSKSKKGANSNIVIASPTGSGKTLAFVLPLLASTKRDAFGKILIVTPTQDLAFQIQRVVDQLWDHVNNYSGMYIVQPFQGNDIDQKRSWTIAEMKLSKSPIIAGTPKSLYSLASYCRQNNVDLFNKVSSIVLDEADRLLQTESIARGEKGYHQNSLTEQLLDEMKKMGVSLKNDKEGGVRLICASATIGRTIRRQIMEITGSSSIDKGATLVSADERTAKNEMKRRNSLLPSIIHHSYALYEDDQMIESLWDTLKDLPPAPTLIFPGKIGVVKMVEKLQAFNLDYVSTLRDEVHWDESAEENSNDILSWKKAPIFVVGEKFGRGLDIPKVKYVFLAAPPTSPAAYAHLAGRTGRGVGNKGDAIVMVQGMKEAIRLVSLARTLGLEFASARNISESTNHDDLKNAEHDDTLNNVEDLRALNVIELKDMLRTRGLKVSGRKMELIERLQDLN